MILFQEKSYFSYYISIYSPFSRSLLTSASQSACYNLKLDYMSVLTADKIPMLNVNNKKKDHKKRRKLPYCLKMWMIVWPIKLYSNLAQINLSCVKSGRRYHRQTCPKYASLAAGINMACATMCFVQWIIDCWEHKNKYFFLLSCDKQIWSLMSSIKIGVLKQKQLTANGLNHLLPSNMKTNDWAWGKLSVFSHLCPHLALPLSGPPSLTVSFWLSLWVSIFIFIFLLLCVYLTLLLCLCLYS